MLDFELIPLTHVTPATVRVKFTKYFFIENLKVISPKVK